MRVMEDIVHWNGGDHLGRPERDLFGRPSTQPTGGSSYTGVGWGALKSAVKSPFNVRWISLDFRCPSVGFPLPIRWISVESTVGFWGFINA